jgi:hypothetical protein
MAFTFKPEELFSKGIVYAEFFDPATDDLLGYSRYVADFSLAGAMNNGEVEAGPGNGLVMMIPDSARLNITATTADSALNNMALAVGGTLSGNGVVETTTAITAASGTLLLNNAVAPLGGENGAVCYILTSTGSDRNAVEAQSGVAHSVDGNAVQDFEAVPGNTYCVKYFYQNSSAQQLTVPAMYAAKVVRAHFAVNCYAKKTGGDVLSSSLFKIRHYVFPYYFFTNPMEDTLSQTATGTVNLSGTCLSYQEAASEGVCNVESAGVYGYVVDEYVGGESSSTAAVDGIYFIGLGAGVSVPADESMTLPIKYSVNGILTTISDMSAVTFTSSDEAVATVDGNSVTGVSAGTSVISASVTNSRTGETYEDTITVTVTA